MCTVYTAADVFQLMEHPEHSKKKLEVCASYFEIYLGKVTTITHTYTTHTYTTNELHVLAFRVHNICISYGEWCVLTRCLIY